MGLDITAGGHAQLVHTFDSPEHDDDVCPDEYEWVYSEEEFVDRLDGRPQGCYIFPDGEEILRFNPGFNTYTEYNRWRDILSRLTLGVAPEVAWEYPDEYKGKPFYELICMADNQGAIGPITSKKLMEDFERFATTGIQAAYERLSEQEPELTSRGFEFWIGRYELWLRAFTLASDDGLVIFH